MLKNIDDLATNPNGFAFEPTHGESFILNETGQQLLEWIRNKQSPEEMASRLSKNYGLPFGEALSDVLDFYARLRFLEFEVK